MTTHAEDLVGLQFDVDYSGASGQFVGEGALLACSLLQGQGGRYDDDAAKRFSVWMSSPLDPGPTDL